MIDAWRHRYDEMLVARSTARSIFSPNCVLAKFLFTPSATGPPKLTRQLLKRFDF